MNIILKSVLYIILPIAMNPAFSETNFTFPEKADLTSGYIPITKKDNLFYLLVKSQKKNSPLVIWLSGGPGASSMTGAFAANGPYLLQNPFSHDLNYTLVQNPWAWNKIANIVYLDQPRYVGYSYGTGNYLTSLEEAGHDFLKWLQLFYQRYPEFKHRPLYLTGESFAGAYIAEFTHQILQYNKNNPKNAIKLSGLFVQSGVVANNGRFYNFDVSPRYPLLYLCDQKLLPGAACDVSKENSLQSILNTCVAHIATSKHISPKEVKMTDVYDFTKKCKECEKYIHEIQTLPKTRDYTIPNIPTIPESIRGKTIQEPVDSLEFNEDSQVRRYLGYSPGPYNIKLACQASGGYPPWCYDTKKINKFFNNAQVKSWLGNKLIPAEVQWEYAKFLIPLTLIGTKSPIPIESYYVEALQNNIKIIFAFGKNDWSLNYLSAQVITNEMTNKAYGQSIFSELPVSPSSMNDLMISDHQHAGEYKSLRNLTFVQIDNAGHIIGMDKPEAIYKLFSSLVQN